MLRNGAPAVALPGALHRCHRPCRNPETKAQKWKDEGEFASSHIRRSSEARHSNFDFRQKMPQPSADEALGRLRKTESCPSQEEGYGCSIRTLRRRGWARGFRAGVPLVAEAFGEKPVIIQLHLRLQAAPGPLTNRGRHQRQHVWIHALDLLQKLLPSELPPFGQELTKKNPSQYNLALNAMPGPSPGLKKVSYCSTAVISSGLRIPKRKSPRGQTQLIYSSRVRAPVA